MFTSRRRHVFAVSCKRRGQFTRNVWTTIDPDSISPSSTFRLSHHPPLSRSAEKPPHPSKLVNRRQSGYAKYIAQYHWKKRPRNFSRILAKLIYLVSRARVLSSFSGHRFFPPVFFITIFTSLHYLFHLIRLQLKVATNVDNIRLPKTCSTTLDFLQIQQYSLLENL